MDLLIGCKVVFDKNGKKSEGIVTKVDAQDNGSYFWVLLDSGEPFVVKVQRCRIDEDDMNLSKEFSDNRIKRLKMMGRTTLVPREALIDLD